MVTVSYLYAFADKLRLMRKLMYVLFIRVIGIKFKLPSTETEYLII